MPRKKVSIASIEEKLRQAGIEPGRPQEGVPIQIAISGRVSTDVGDEIARLSNAFTTAMAEALRGVSFESPITALVLFPTLLASEISPMPEFIQHRRDGSVFVGLTIDHALWNGASPPEKAALFAENIQNSIRKIKETRLLPVDRAKLLDSAHRAHQVVRSRSVN